MRRWLISFETVCLHADTVLPDVSQAESWHPLCYAVAGISSYPPPRVLFLFLFFFFFNFFSHYTFCVKIKFLCVMKSFSTLKTGRERLSYNGFNMRKP